MLERHIQCCARCCWHHIWMWYVLFCYVKFYIKLPHLFPLHLTLKHSTVKYHIFYDSVNFCCCIPFLWVLLLSLRFANVHTHTITNYPWVIEMQNLRSYKSYLFTSGYKSPSFISHSAFITLFYCTISGMEHVFLEIHAHTLGVCNQSNTYMQILRVCVCVSVGQNAYRKKDNLCTLWPRPFVTFKCSSVCVSEKRVSAGLWPIPLMREIVRVFDRALGMAYMPYQ